MDTERALVPAVRPALAAACPALADGTADDAVAGVVPAFVASPSSTQQASALLRAAAEAGLAVVPRGAGTGLAWGGPPSRCDLVVDLRSMDQIVEHEAGDLVARVQAGATIGQLAVALGSAGQQLALDVPAEATVGGVVATGTAGPRRFRYGAPRDLLIGITVVRADGVVAHAGGKVVKNVAGYDLGKLFAGSYGTLGLIVEAAFRLHPLPAAATYTTADAAGPAEARRMVAAAAGSQLAPTAVEISRPGRDQPVHVGVLLEGDPAGVGERSAHLRELLGAGAVTSPDVPAWWGRTGPPDGQNGAGTLIRVGFWAAALPAVLAAIDAAAATSGLDPLVAGSAAAGVIYVALGAGAHPAAVAAFVAALREAIARGAADARPASAPVPDSPPVLASAVVVHAPPAVRELADMWGPVPGLPLMRAVKDQFDPGHRMAPGRFAGGI